MDVNLVYDTESCLPLYLEDVVIDVDVSKMSQVIRNLMSNAIAFTPKGGHVTVKTKFIDRALEISDAKNGSALISASTISLSGNSIELVEGERRHMTHGTKKSNALNEFMHSGILHFEVSDTGYGMDTVTILHIAYFHYLSFRIGKKNC